MDRSPSVSVPRLETRRLALVSPGNAASLRVAAELGMRHDRDVDLWGRVVGAYVREKSGE